MPQLVPITREVLRVFYQGYPLDPVPSDELATLTAGIDAAIQQMALIQAACAQKVEERFGMETPKRCVLRGTSMHAQAHTHTLAHKLAHTSMLTRMLAHSYAHSPTLIPTSCLTHARRLDDNFWWVVCSQCAANEGSWVCV